MKALIFNGTFNNDTNSTPGFLSQYLKERLQDLGTEGTIFNIAGSGIPLFDPSLKKIPRGVEWMKHLFLQNDLHFWLAPLYHGSIPGIMKNCMDWLEVTAKNDSPYLTDKIIAMICWADGAQAMQGINTMDTIARALRAWPMPYSVPIVRPFLFEEKSEGDKTISPYYKAKLDMLLKIATTRKIVYTGQ